MKINRYTTTLILAFMLLLSCKKDNINYQSDFNKSYNTWLTFKNEANNSYQYQVVTSSWTGFSSYTTITVTNGKVSQRSYIAKTIDGGSGSIKIYDEWTEKESELGSHQNGQALLTLDQIYEKAKSDWLLKRDNANTSFEAKNNGMISSCGYVEKNCADDCFVGITISFISKN